jgi:hypothetical protein
VHNNSAEIKKNPLQILKSFFVEYFEVQLLFYFFLDVVGNCLNLRSGITVGYDETITNGIVKT